MNRWWRRLLRGTAYLLWRFSGLRHTPTPHFDDWRALRYGSTLLPEPTEAEHMEYRSYLGKRTGTQEPEW